MPVQRNTIGNYFVRSGEEGMEEFYRTLNETLLFYKFPSQICLSSTYIEGTLLGTLQFQELDINGYPIYTGDVVDEFDTTYVTILNFNRSVWTFTLNAKNTEITINSITTNNINPTKVDYVGISRPTAGACRVGLAPR